MRIDLARLDRIQDERMFVCIETNDLYAIQEINVIGEEIWITAQDGRVFKDTEVLTVKESGDHYRLRTWMNKTLKIDF